MVKSPHSCGKNSPFVPRVFLLPAVPHASASAEIVLVSGGMVQIDPFYLYIVLIHLFNTRYTYIYISIIIHICVIEMYPLMCMCIYICACTFNCMCIFMSVYV